MDKEVNYKHPSTSTKEVFVLILIITPVITVVFLIDERSIFDFFKCRGLGSQVYCDILCFATRFYVEFQSFFQKRLGDKHEMQFL